MKKILLTFLLVLLIPSGMEAQRRNGLISRRIESSGFLTFSAGPSFCNGDAGSTYNQTFVNGLHNYDLSLGFRHILRNGFSYKASFDFINFAGSDKDSKLEYRNYSNISNVFELSGRGEYSYYFGRRYGRAMPNSFFGFVGAGILNSSTRNTGDSQQYNEEQSPILAAFIPYGIGYQYQLNAEFTIGAEVGGQYAFSDYVDGFHSIRYSKSNDVLTNFKFTVSYKLF